MKITFFDLVIEVNVRWNGGYYAIMSAYVDYPIGYCYGSDRESVLEEEPGVTFKRISKKEYDRRIEEEM